MVRETIQQTINQRPRTVALVTLILILASFAWSYYQLKPAGIPPTPGDFVDERTGQPVNESAGALPPLKGSSGELTIVHCVYYSCKETPGRWPAYYEKIDPTALDRVKADIARAGPGGGVFLGRPPSYQQNLLIRLPGNGSQWVKAFSQEGNKLISELRCPHGGAHHFSPSLIEVP